MLTLPSLMLIWVTGGEAEIRQFCFNLTGKYAIACAVVESEKCTIYAPKFRHDKDDKAFARIGEEVAHCFYGDFHK